MIRRYIANLSTNIFKRACAAAAVLVLTGGCSPPKPPINTTTSSPIAPVEQNQLSRAVEAKNPNKPQKSVSAPSCTQNDPFAESINFATQAANLAQSANSKQDWDEVAALWVQAVAWMQAVPPGNPRRAFAEKKVVEYMRNLVYSQQQAGSSRSSASTVSFSSDLLDEQLQLYLSYVAAVGPPDVLIVGSSRALQGIDPKGLKQSLAANGRPGLQIFNFGVNGATAQVVDFQLRRLLKPDHLPQMIIWADGVRAFNSGREDRTFDSIVDSDGNKLLVAGVRPKLPSNGPNVASQCYSFPEPCGSPSFHRAQATASSSFQDLDTGINSNWMYSPPGILPVAGPVATYQFQPIATSVTAQRGQLIPLAPSGPVAIRQVSELADSIDSNGFMSLSDRYNPNTYYRQRAYVSGRYDRDYEDFNLGGKQAKAFNSVVAFAKTRKIPLVLVSLPVTDDYLDGTRRWAEQQFRQRMQRLSRSQGFFFRDLSQRWPNRNDFFVDPSHLNRFGAIAVARQIAADDSIPWPSPRSRSNDG